MDATGERCCAICSIEAVGFKMLEALLGQPLIICCSDFFFECPDKSQILNDVQEEYGILLNTFEIFF